MCVCVCVCVCDRATNSPFCQLHYFDRAVGSRPETILTFERKIPVGINRLIR